MLIDGFFEKRLLGYLAGLVSAQDALDYTAHDKRYHGGRFDPSTMTCGMREAENTGDLVDVLRAEEQEERDWTQFIRKHPELMTDEEFTKYFGKPKRLGQMRMEVYIRKNYKPARPEGGGTFLGQVNGMKVYPHTKMPLEMAKSKNAFWLMKNDKNAFSDKALIIRDIKSILKGVAIDGIEVPSHKSNSHSAWQIANGFATASFHHGGRNWYFVFTVTADGRYLLYDAVRKNKGVVSKQKEEACPR